MTKKQVFLLGLVGIALFFVAMYPVNLGICKKIAYSCRTNADLAQMLLGVFPFVFIFSLITYKMQEEVFRIWWGFARWFAPMIILITFLLETSPDNGGGFLSFPGMLSFVVLSILYPVFILVSIVKIVRAYQRFK